MTLHRLHKHSSEDMYELDNNSIHLCVTSPPYNANKPYSTKNRLDPRGQKISREKNSDSLPWEKYIKKMKQIISEVYRVLVPGGKFCINVGDIGRYKVVDDTEYNLVPLHMLWWSICTQLNFVYEGMIVWVKENGEKSGSFGSWRTYTRPIIQDIHEFILVFAKPPVVMDKNGQHPRYTMTKEEFLDLNKSVWTFRAESHNVHPAIFPDELPRRLIKLFSGPLHTVLDPFAGSGTVARVSKQLNRNSVSYEIEKAYYPLIENITLQTSIDEWFERQPTPMEDQ